MKSSEAQVALAPPNLIKALLAGFDSIANHVGLILIPVAIDHFLWMGPRLQVKTLLGKFFQQVFSTPGLLAPEWTETFQVTRQQWLEVVERLNLFAALRAYPVGIPSLVAPRLPLDTPFGQPHSLDLPSFDIALLLWVILFLIGLGLGSFYFMAVAQASLQERMDWRTILTSWPRSTFQVFLLTLFWFGLMMAASLPASCLVILVAMTGLGGSTALVLLYFGFVVWVLFPLIFSPHGITAYQRPMWTSVLESIRLVRFSFPLTSMMLVILIIIGEGLDYLWNVPSDNSLLLSLAIIAHAFVTTSLLATSFIYYRDANRWMQRVIQQAKLASAT